MTGNRLKKLWVIDVTGMKAGNYNWNGKIFPGVWTIELWHDGVCLYSGSVTLN
ncbi:MAG: hypothetical protein LBD20_07880 [Spirochaetaceae bacterium]|jgi:hypothetical protein|nr:hypothetical protein [Spirochaetaceae bacterium]